MKRRKFHLFDRAVPGVLTLLLLLSIAFTPPLATAEDPEDAIADSAGEGRFVVYYFHRTARCKTCRMIEAYSHDAIAEGFSSELASGLLEWRLINVEEGENAHFTEDFQLVSGALVVAEYRGETASRWKNLVKVWRLTGDREKFTDYVRQETRLFIEQTDATP